ncbi:MAG: RNA polymerase sigma factor [Oscillospiraceae bacterium]|nr:RNA polymerase sigma factor [Oscillospiraceae bacterium]
MIYSRYLAERNEEDFRILLERHKESLMLFLFSLIHNMEDAEELMLDAYAEAAAGAVYSGKSTFRTWLFSIGKNMALMHLRKQRFTSEVPFEQTDETAAPPELDILREERNRQLYEALSRLREEYRQILILLYFEDMSHEEAGRIMEKNRKQVYNLAERGRAALREQLERMGFDDAQYR